MSVLRLILCLCLSLLVSACVSQSVKSTSVPTIATASTAVTEELLLDVAIVVFDPGLDDYDEDQQVYPEVRKAEARFMPLLLSEAMQDSVSWGAVRVVPDDAQITDLMVQGKILHSDGEQLQLAITATDSRGNVWLDNKYTGHSSRYAYASTTRNSYDPFQAVYNTIANDLLRQLEQLQLRDREDVRLVTELLFARSFSEDAFAGWGNKTSLIRDFAKGGGGTGSISSDNATKCASHSDTSIRRAGSLFNRSSNAWRSSASSRCKAYSPARATSSL